jgi:hypothetical protein
MRPLIVSVNRVSVQGQQYHYRYICCKYLTCLVVFPPRNVGALIALYKPVVFIIVKFDPELKVERILIMFENKLLFEHMSQRNMN